MGRRHYSGLSSASLGGNGDGDDAVQVRKGGSWEGKISNSMAEALGSHCQGRTFLGMLGFCSHFLSRVPGPGQGLEEKVEGNPAFLGLPPTLGRTLSAFLSNILAANGKFLAP